jgi:type IV pilus assembly protein PilC
VKVKSAMIYPVAVIVIAAVVVGAILWKVIPTFASLFAGLGAQLPLPTRIVMALSSNCSSWGYMPSSSFRRSRRVPPVLRHLQRPAGRRPHPAQGADSGEHPAQDRGRTVLPHDVHAAQRRACRSSTGSTSPRDGGQRDHRRRHPGDAHQHRARRDGVRPAARDGVFPPMVVQMIGVGETTGALDTMLGKIADFYEEEVDTAVAGLLTLMEPIMIAFLGGVVGGIVIAMYLPIFDLISKLT